MDIVLLSIILLPTAQPTNIEDGKDSASDNEMVYKTYMASLPKAFTGPPTDSPSTPAVSSSRTFLKNDEHTSKQTKRPAETDIKSRAQKMLDAVPSIINLPHASRIQFPTSWSEIRLKLGAHLRWLVFIVICSVCLWVYVRYIRPRKDRTMSTDRNNFQYDVMSIPSLLPEEELLFFEESICSRPR